jgi:hypothetical protein
LPAIITKWQKENIKGIPLPKTPQLLMLLSAYDPVTITNRGVDSLQKAAYKLNQTVTEHV